MTNENRIQSMKTQEPGWKIQRKNTMGISFYKAGELKESSYIKLRLRSSAILTMFFWSTLAKLHPCEISSNRVSNYGQHFDELGTQGFVFPN